MKIHVPAAVTAALILSSCTWVELERGAEGVRLVEPSHVLNCERLGTTTTSVKSRVAGVERDPDKVAAELADLARNSAWDMNGDTIVADGPARDGEQRFVIYRCRSR
ncbi:DUF4156 domain-containing protein [Wenzhouxiangella sediminis]|uniref:DUF4156 domain-containing protein n=1 Tax=Wenzhouxiangella sediminis TaxID=1792836 RepID=A0A3E1KCU8_9GAMM|nr:DUF4156 domain-containing protein [Wenzhouxiangella sediminis]RFF32845.1 DUF4156 domain-containing protein [Wenzhouxiangella sediminis]